MKVIYIAGPMRGHYRFNYQAFDDAKSMLRAAGWEVFNPVDFDRGIDFHPEKLPEDTDWNDPAAIGFSIDDAITRDVAAIQQADAIYMLTGWQKSKGARAEHAIAEWRGIEIYYQGGEETILDEAARITSGDRQASYGPPDQDFARTAAMWSAIKGVSFEPREVAMFMIALKLSRETHQRKRDNWVDVAGYAHCGSQCR
jgi:hypothetical protein